MSLRLPVKQIIKREETSQLNLDDTNFIVPTETAIQEDETINKAAKKTITERSKKKKSENSHVLDVLGMIISFSLLLVIGESFIFLIACFLEIIFLLLCIVKIRNNYKRLIINLIFAAGIAYALLDSNLNGYLGVMIYILLSVAYFIYSFKSLFSKKKLFKRINSSEKIHPS